MSFGENASSPPPPPNDSFSTLVYNATVFNAIALQFINLKCRRMSQLLVETLQWYV